jgi:hypothetical protein
MTHLTKVGTCNHCGISTENSPDPIECSGCWELRTRIEQNPNLARHFLANIDTALAEHARIRDSLEALRTRHVAHRVLVDRIISRFLAARTCEGFQFIKLEEIAALVRDEVPVLADVLSTLTLEGYAQRRYAVRIPEHGVEQFYGCFQEIPDNFVVASGVVVATEDTHVCPEYCATEQLAA